MIHFARCWCLTIAAAMCALPTAVAHAQEHGHHHHSGGPLDYAPIGVMGEHRHRVSESMLSYRFGYMWKDGNRTGTSSTSLDDVLMAYMVAPKDMWMMVHMLGYMYAPSDRVTFTVMVPYVIKQMEHRTRAGAEFTTKSEGLSDIKAAALVGLGHWGVHNLHLNAGLSIPFGKVDEKGDTPVGKDQKLPYPMQTGSGTWDLLPGLTYTALAGDWSWGGQGHFVIRLGENDEGYRFGHGAQATTWFARRVLESLSASARVVGTAWRNVKGADEDLNPMMVPTADPKLRRGYRFDAALGLNYLATGGYFQGHRLGIEFFLPFYQDLEGPQLETGWSVMVGWQYAFKP